MLHYFDEWLDHIVVSKQVRLVSDFCPSSAGGLEVGYLNLLTVGSLHIYNSQFVENQAVLTEVDCTCSQ